jgi:hypothetical protein
LGITADIAFELVYDTGMSELSPPVPSGLRWLQRVDHVEDLARQAARAQTQYLVALAAFAVEEHHHALGSEAVNSLALGLGLSPRQMSNRLGDALGFHLHPRLAGLVMDGTWLVEHANAVLAGLGCADLTAGQEAQVLDLVLARCRSRVPWELKKAVQAAVAVLFPDLLQAQADKAQTGRDVRLFPSRLGEAQLAAFGPAHQVEAMLTVLDTMTFPPAPDDTRSAGERRFDCLHALLTGQATPSQWQVLVLTQLETLLGDNEHPAETTRGQLIPAQVARDLAAQGTLRRVLVDEQGRLVAVEASTDQLSPDRPSPVSASPAPVPAPRAETDLEDDAAVLEPDPDAPSDDDGTWFEQQQAAARICDPLPVPAVTPVNAEPLAAGDEEPLEVAAEMAAEESLDEPVDQLFSDAGAEPAAVPALASAPEDSLTRRLQQLLARPFTPADLSSPGYRPSRPLRRHLALRDRTCRFPGCPNRICDLDHVTVWPAGPTSATNLARECEHHHQAKHQHFDVRLLPDGTLRWTDRGGRHFDSPVPTVLITAPFHHHQRRDHRHSTDPPADDGSEGP